MKASDNCCHNSLSLTMAQPGFHRAWTTQSGVRDAVGAVGTALAVALFLSPLPLVKRIRAKRDTDGFSPLPYLVTCAQCAIWFLYCCITTGNVSPAVANVIGVVLEAAWVSQFIVFSPVAAKPRLLQACVAAAGGVLLLVILALALPRPTAQNVVGWIAVALNVAMYSAPLGVMGTVLRTRSVEAMPLSLSAIGLVCSFVWAGYGLYCGDLRIMVPNALGVLLSAAQVLLWGFVAATGDGAPHAAALLPSLRRERAPLLLDEEGLEGAEGLEEVTHAPLVAG